MTAPLIERLAIKSGVMQMGEPIAWGSDTALMDEAAAELVRLGRERAALREALQRCCEEFEQWHDAKAVLAIARAVLEAKP
jgi:hypothetical protein